MLDKLLLRRLLVAIWLCFVARGLYYACATPLWEGLDEFREFTCVQLVAGGTIFPPVAPQLSREIDASLGLAPLARSLVAVRASATTHDGFWKRPEAERRQSEAALRALSSGARLQKAAANRASDARRLPLYYWLAAPVYSAVRGFPLLESVFLLRVFNVLLASAAVPLAFQLARTVFPDEAAALCAVAAFSAMPQVMFNISHVGSDPLALLLATGLALITIRARTTSGVVILGVLLAAALLTREYFVALLPACFVLFIGRWRQAAIAIGLSLLGAGWWYIGQWQSLWGGPHQDSLSSAVTKVDWSRAADFGWNTLIWTGNWSYLGLRSWIYRIMLLLCLIAVFGLARSARNLGLPAVTLVMFHVALAATLGFQALEAVRSGAQAFPPGWYLCSLAAAWACLMVRGFRALAPVAAAVPVFVFAALDLYGSHVVLTPYYAGLIAYSSTGRLAAFPLVRWSYEVFDRLAVNKPVWLASPAIAGLWAFYVIGTFTLLGIAVWAVRAVRVDVCRSTE